MCPRPHCATKSATTRNVVHNDKEVDEVLLMAVLRNETADVHEAVGFKKCLLKK